MDRARIAGSAAGGAPWRAGTAAAPAGRARAAGARAAAGLTQAVLIEYLAAGAVTELVLAQCAPGAWRLEVALAWRTERAPLVAARGAERHFRSLDTAVRFLQATGIGSTVVRLELAP